MDAEYKYKETTGNVIGAAMQVHKVLGNGFTHLDCLFFMVFVNAAHFRK
jgi:hypothetical protein